MFTRNTPPADDTQTPSDPPKLVPQRTFSVEYVDGSSVAQETVVTCRVLRIIEGVLYFADVTPDDVQVYAEVIVLAVSLSRVVTYREIVSSNLIVN
jgi:hypothetical protein